MIHHIMENFGESKRAYNVTRGQYSLAMALLKNSELGSNAKVLDIGAGMGEFASILTNKGFQVVCTDGAKHCHEHLLKNGFQSNLVDLEIEKLPFSGESFDLVVSIEVIEHLWNTEQYLSEIKRVLKPGGYFICTTPNYNHWRFRFDTLLGRFERFTYRSRHKKFYTTRSLPRELCEYFSIKKQLGLGWLPKTGIQFITRYFQNFLSVHTGVLCKKQ